MRNHEKSFAILEEQWNHPCQDNEHEHVGWWCEGDKQTKEQWDSALVNCVGKEQHVISCDNDIWYHSLLFFYTLFTSALKTSRFIVAIEDTSKIVKPYMDDTVSTVTYLLLLLSLGLSFTKKGVYWLFV